MCKHFPKYSAVGALCALKSQTAFTAEVPPDTSCYGKKLPETGRKRNNSLIVVSKMDNILIRADINIYFLTNM